MKKLLRWPFRLVGWAFIAFAAMALPTLVEATERPAQSRDMMASVLCVTFLIALAGVLLMMRSKPRR